MSKRRQRAEAIRETQRFIEDQSVRAMDAISSAGIREARRARREADVIMIAMFLAALVGARRAAKTE